MADRHQLIRTLVVVQGTSLVLAALIHFGILAGGYEHPKAGTAETVIGLVLLTAAAGTIVAPAATRAIGLAAQTFGLLGTLVGLFTIAIGVGPQTAADLIYHAALVALLVTGLVVTARSRPWSRPR